jgi:murein DD-endopeptidase MepM/ murein hydrolase activator NlpD
VAVVGLLALVEGSAASAGVPSRDGGTPYYGHVFPVNGPHGVRGAVGEFHAPRSGGRIHEGFDITAACGAELVAVRNGRVRQVGFDPVLYGNYVLIHGEAEKRSYFYAHMPSPALVGKGQFVYEGQRVGAVGETGNAVGTGCHLHFEIHVEGVPIDPLPSLTRWDRYS